MIERRSPYRPFMVEDTLSCGCLVNFLPDADQEQEIAHEKSQSVLDVYNELFGVTHRNVVPKRVLEIGVKHGGSLSMWRDRFGAEVHGIDPHPQLGKVFNDHAGRCVPGSLFVHQAPAVPSELEVLGEFDLIIDDGSHEFDDIETARAALWKKLTRGGLYVIEDWRTDAGRPYDLFTKILKEMVGYWPDPKAPDGAPKNVWVKRDAIVLEAP